MIKKIRSLICVIFALMLIAAATIPASAAVSADDDELALEITDVIYEQLSGKTFITIEYENNLGEEMNLFFLETEIVATTNDGKDYYGDWWENSISKGSGTLKCYFDCELTAENPEMVKIPSLKRGGVSLDIAKDIVLFEDGEIVENVVVDFSLNTDIAAAVGVSGIAVILSGIFTIIGGLITLLGPLLVILIFAGSSLLFILIVVIIIIAVVKHNKKNKQSNTTYTPVTGESNGDDGGFAPPPEM